MELKAGPRKWIARMHLVLCFQAVMYMSLLLCFYAILTLNWELIALLAIISILQNLVHRNQTIINIVNKYIEPLNYFQSFTRIYEENIMESTSIFCFHPHSIFCYCICFYLYRCFYEHES